MTQIDDWREILVLSAAYETGLLARLASAATPDALADDVGLDPRAVRITLEALIDCGWVTADVDGVQLSGRGVAALGGGSGDQVIAEVLLAAREIAAFLELPATLRSGAPAHDVSAGDAATRQRFLAAMRAISERRVPATVRALQVPPGGGRMLDVGGGPGTYARAFTQAGWAVTVLDLAESLELGGADLDRWGVRQIAGDATEGIPEGPWDCVYLGNITHLFGPEVAERLIVGAGAALVPGGRLAIQEVVRGLAATAALFGVAMLLGTRDGDVYDPATYARWMSAAGCPLAHVIPTEPERHHLLIGVRG